MQQPFIKTHAGGYGITPNTMPYILKSIASGVQMVEIDVQMTQDHVPIAWHDDSIADQMINQTPYAELKLKKPELLTFEQAIQPFTGNDLLINVDLKTLKACDQISGIAKRYKILQRISVSGVQFSDIVTVKKYFDNESIWVSTQYYPDGIEEDRWQGYIDYNLSAARDYCCCHLNCFYCNVSKTFIEQAHNQNLRVHVWTVNRPMDMRRMIEWGADSIATEQVDLLKRFLKEPC